MSGILCGRWRDGVQSWGMSGETCLRIPILTTERTTAFMPALSPPDVSTAILMGSDGAMTGGSETSDHIYLVMM